MAIFGKKEDEFEKEEKSGEGRKITRKFRDLSPENKKKRKEPPRPWGKKERIIVLVVLLVTTTISAILLLKNSLKFNFGSLNPFKGETIIINKK
jgi:hypothetical protein